MVVRTASRALSLSLSTSKEKKKMKSLRHCYAALGRNLDSALITSRLQGLFVTLMPLFTSVFLLSFSCVVCGDTGSKVNDLYPGILREEAVTRLNQLGKISDESGYLERTFMSPASVKAGNLVSMWMEDAGLKTWVDNFGNIHGRIEGMNSSNEALLIGSHMDTVIDAGIYDGSLGIVAAISALKVLNQNGELKKLNRPVEVIAFSDEEGVRFQSTFLGSSAIAGQLSASTLLISDKRGMTVQEALRENSIALSDEKLLRMKYDPSSVWGYIEVHIEQGPVLESLGVPLGVVEGIAGQTRLKVTVSGKQGHAGTVPMTMRKDAMTAAAELILLLENLCRFPNQSLRGAIHSDSQSPLSLVCTVGEIDLWPGASNVIPSKVAFTIDIRSSRDSERASVIREFTFAMDTTCGRRGVRCLLERKHDVDAVVCDEEFKSRLRSAAEVAMHKLTADGGVLLPEVMSGAGHDAMAMSGLTKVGLLFVRCRGGISHSPLEYVLDDDVWAAGMAVLSFLETLA